MLSLLHFICNTIDRRQLIHVLIKRTCSFVDLRSERNRSLLKTENSIKAGLSRTCLLKDLDVFNLYICFDVDQVSLILKHTIPQFHNYRVFVNIFFYINQLELIVFLIQCPLLVGLTWPSARRPDTEITFIIIIIVCMYVHYGHRSSAANFQFTDHLFTEKFFCSLELMNSRRSIMKSCVQ